MEVVAIGQRTHFPESLLSQHEDLWIAQIDERRLARAGLTLAGLGTSLVVAGMRAYFLVFCDSEVLLVQLSKLTRVFRYNCKLEQFTVPI